MNDLDILSTFYWRTSRISLKTYLILKESLLQNGWKNFLKGIANPHLQEKYSSYQQWVEIGKRELSWIYENQFKFVNLENMNYPVGLLTMPYPPLILIYKGEEIWLKGEALSVVGSRRSTVYAEQWLDYELISFLKQAQHIYLVSGGAKGIDQRAHKSALRVKVPTLCLLPSGLRKPYPGDIRPLLQSIVEHQGTIMSQFSPFSEIYKSHFYFRNELLVFFSKMVFIVEASLKSGSMMTAKLAIDNHREIIVLPTSPQLPNSSGVLKLMAEGAPFVRNAEELSAFWGPSSFNLKLV